MGSILEMVMTLEQVFTCTRTLKKLRSGPLGGLLDGFCNALLQDGFTTVTTRKHLSNISHLNAYIGARSDINGLELSAQTVSEFLRDYPTQARNRGR
jgi:hypothetical protein